MASRIIQIKGRVRIFDTAKPEVTLYEKRNVICNGVAYLFSRLLLNSMDPIAGVWGLALGAGGQSGTGGWSPTAQPDATATQITMVSEIKRKQLALVNYLDTNDLTTTTLTTRVKFRTVINATTDNITAPIREMGLIGGGTRTIVPPVTAPTDMTIAPYFDPAAPSANTVILVNYVTIPPFTLPPGENIGIDWILEMGDDVDGVNV